MVTTEIYCHVWQQDEMWMVGIVDHTVTPSEQLKPDGDVAVGYSALSLLDPNLLIHVYWIGGLPSDDERDYCQDLIISQALAFYAALAQGGA